jgi:hypothetical protein
MRSLPFLPFAFSLSYVLFFLGIFSLFPSQFIREFILLSIFNPNHIEIQYRERICHLTHKSRLSYTHISKKEILSVPMISAKLIVLIYPRIPFSQTQ